MSARDDERLDAEITELDVRDEDRDPVASDTVEEHLADDLAAGQGSADDPTAIPAEDVMQLAGIRDAQD